MYLGKNVKHLRKQRKMNQHELGDVIGVTNSQIGGYEIGRSQPSLEALVKLSEYFDIAIDDLLFKDLEKEASGPALAAHGMAQEPAAEYSKLSEGDQLLMGLLKRMEKYIARLEKTVIEKDPEMARQMGLLDDE